MSRRICLPSKWIMSAAAYAASRADAASAPSAVTLSTLPPAVTIAPSAFRAVPAWVTCAWAPAASRPVMTSPCDEVAGYPALASTTLTAISGAHSSDAPDSPPTTVAASSSSSRSDSRRGRIAWVSGSPKRTLNSSTRGPSAVIIRPA